MLSHKVKVKVRHRILERESGLGLDCKLVWHGFDLGFLNRYKGLIFI